MSDLRKYTLTFDERRSRWNLSDDRRNRVIKSIERRNDPRRSRG